MEIDQDIDHEYTNEIVCPFCGSEFGDSWEVESGSEDLGLQQCGDCDKHFYATRNITIDYCTEKANYGTCKHCIKVDVPIEDYHSSVGKYLGLCVDCGNREKLRLEITYIERLTQKVAQSAIEPTA
jgi:transcription elongation factor Elf1